MITKANLKQLLSLLGYKEVSPKRFKREFASFDCSLEVDFESEKLIYPQDKGLKVNDDTTSNFEHPENFVVFECVNRLLEKGYRPEHIELEKKWLLGHDAKSGKADICVYDADGGMLLIIECKTYGKEYKKALKILQTNGGQLFSYWQQEKNTKWISLYASDIADGAVVYENDIIDCSDDANLKLLSQKDDSLKLYSNAHTVDELLEAWQETYIMKLWQGLIFGEDSSAYSIGVRPLRKKDLKDFAPEDKIVNKFEEILRHNNVSDKENAFNRLVALFICKLVDEIRKGDNDEVEFQYKQGTDTYESLQDRLQRLHQAGMEDFMGEKIFYVPADYPEWLFTTYTGVQRKRAIEDLKEKIKILKFYSNNDFSFKDVHNEELFLQNGKILVEVVQLFEKYRIVYPSKHQFLGDLFEQLLNKGFKQNEGQFFTPMPITRFIWDSLPLKEYISAEGTMRHPKVIDYACGAGHFLTEAVEAINSIIPSHDKNDWVRDCIYGIEKDYRLARVAKISMFMNGAGDANIIFGDGLDNAPTKKIENGAFDILVANPPYSVSAFKPHLKLKNNSLELLDSISNDSGDIETLFAERIAQLVKPNGIAAVILPVSFLTKDRKDYTGARDILIKNFYIRAIVQLGKKTFGATPTTTVILFLEKYNEPPKKSDLVKDCVDAILKKSDLENWTDKTIFNSYLECIGVSIEEYYLLLNGDVFTSENNISEYAQMYISDFNNSTEIKNRKKAPAFRKQSTSEQTKELTRRFIEYVQGVEYEKLSYFTLTYDNETTIITSPTDIAELKQFLGYDWSDKKGNEGIIILNEGGMMYDSNNRHNNTTLAAAIRASYKESLWEGRVDNLQYFKRLKTSNMFDFSRPKFNNTIRTSIAAKVVFISKYPIVKLEGIVDVNPPRPNIATIDGNMKVSFVEMSSVSNEGYIETMIDKPLKDVKKGGYTYFAEDDLIFAKITPCMENGKCAIAKDLTNRIGFGSSEFHVFRCSESINKKYLFLILNSAIVRNAAIANMTGSSGHRRVPEIFYKNLQIPLPPMDVQLQIVKESDKIDAEYNSSRMTIETYRQKIAEVFERLQVADTSNWGGGGKTT